MVHCRQPHMTKHGMFMRVMKELALLWQNLQIVV